jgi:alpha-ketoglutarate-dependent taurine dioxygenase
MWDNRQTWHFAVNDYQGQRRVMHRILLAGSKPVPAHVKEGTAAAETR